MINHHVKYKEIHGIDEVIQMSRSEHKKLHLKLRKEGKCNMDPTRLKKISDAANRRDGRGSEYRTKNVRRIEFDNVMAPCIIHREQISLNLNTNNVSVSCYFSGTHGNKLVYGGVV